MAVVQRPSVARVFSTIAAFGAMIFGGCRQTSSEYVEAELRVQSRKVADLENRIAQRDAEIETLRNTVTAFQASHVKPAETPEEIYRDSALSRVTLTLATGGKDADLDGRDDGIVVGIAPHDYDGDVFKCPGSCRVQLFEAPPSSAPRQIGEWVIPPEQLRNLWRASLLGQGYHLALSWQTPPTVKRLRVAVSFATLDGRKFDADKQFDVSLEAKGPPKLPGGRIDADAPPIAPPMAPPAGKQTLSEPAKPRGLGSLSNLNATTSRALTGNGDAFPAPPAPLRISARANEGSVRSAAAPSSVKLPAVTERKPGPWDQEHSPPPVVPHDLRHSVTKPSPGDQSDAEDVIILPKAGTATSKLTTNEPMGGPSSQPPPRPLDPTVPSNIELPSDLPPPKPVNAGPGRIAFPN